MSAIVVRSGAVAAAVSTADDRSFEPNPNQRPDQIRSQTCDDDEPQNGEKFLQRRAYMQAPHDALLEVNDEKRSSGCNRLPDEDAEEKSDDDGWGTTADRSSPTLDLFTTAREAGVEQTAEET